MVSALPRPSASIAGDPSAAETAKIVDAKSVIFDGFTRALSEGAPADAAVWLTGEGREAELTLDAETIAELLIQHHEHGLRSLELLVAAAERAP